MPEALERVRASPNISSIAENPKKDRFGVQLDLCEREGSGYWALAKFGNDFSTLICDISYLGPRGEHLPGDGLLQFHIELQGHLTLMTQEAEPLKVDGPSLLVWTQPPRVDSDEILEPEQAKSVTFYLEPAFLFQEMVASRDQIPMELARFVLGKEKRINYIQLPVTSEIFDATSSLIESTSRFTGLIWLNYVHAKSEELLCYILTAFYQLAASGQVSFTDRELRILQDAKQIFTTEFKPAPTIKHVARRLGTNDTKLKQGFKTLFGETPFDCRNRHRMRLALQLLDDGVPIAIVSEKVGFQHQTSFANAFKSFFDFTPREYRKKNK